MTDAFGSAGRRSLALVLALALLGSVFFGTMPVFATGGSVAKIGEMAYDTLDEAVEKSKEGDTIVLLQDCELTKGFNKTLTFTGNGKITINKQLTSNGEGWMCFGLYDPSRVLTFDGSGVEVEWNSEVGTNPWLMLSLSGTLNVINGAKVSFTVDSGASGKRNAIYMNSGSVINVLNRSTFEIKGNKTAGTVGQGIQLDKIGQSEINVKGNSTFLIDGTNRGYVNSPAIYVEDSSFTVQNCTANGSNGGNFTAVRSKIQYLNNAGHGLSASDLKLQEHSELNSDGNGYYGVFVSGEFLVDGTCTVKVMDNSSRGDYAGLKLTSSVSDGKVEAGAVITITGNHCSGLSNNGKVVFEEGSKLTITENINDKGTSSHGGGVYNSGSNADLTLPSDAVIYNNHSKTDGDDIFNNTTASITFGEVDPGWMLDDCSHVIDGWYDDSENTRWKAHETGSIDDNHIEEFMEFTDGIAEVNELKALKAAHGLILPAWDISKSKTATNLDENLESDVTLALPAAEYRQTMDVVFVIDDTHAGSGIFAKSVSNLLDELASKKNLDISVGVVAFDAVSRDWLSATSGGAWSRLVSIQEEGALDALKTAVKTELSYDSDGYRKKVGGTNTEWPVEMASQMLQDGSGEDKYLIMFSDLYGYIYRGDLTIDGDTYHNVPLSKRLGNWDQGSLSMGTKYSNFADAYANRNDAANQTPDGFFRDSSWDSYWNVYQDVDPVPENTIAGSYQVSSNSYSGFEKSLCLTYDRLTSAAQNARVILVNNSFENKDAPNAQSMIKQMLDALESGSSGVTTYRYPTGSANEALSGDAAGNIFNGIREQLIQLVDDGSYVADEIGSGMFDGTAYDFAFVSDASRLSLTVGGESLKATALSGQDLSGASAAWQFGDEEKPNQFTLYYYENGITYEGNSYGECLIWEIHVPVTKDAPVQLTYSVRLTDPQTDPKKYGEYDADGSEGYPGLYTNNSATLYPKNSYGKSGQPEAFGKPTVSYKAGVSVIVPADPTPGTPLEPVTSTPDSSEPSAPGSSSTPSDPGVSSRPAVSDGASEPSDSVSSGSPSSGSVTDPDVPKTGDDSSLVLWLTLAGAALIGLTGMILIVRRKENEDLSD